MNGSAITYMQTFVLDLKGRLSLFARRVEMDRAVLYLLLARLVGLISGPITAILIATNFTPTIQGYYFTFGSIVALQTFAELGFGFAIIQFASHEWANLSIDKDRRISGDPDSLSRLASLARIAIKWNLIAGVVAITGLSIGGYLFFSKTPSQDVNWKLPWFSLCVLTGVMLFTTGIWSLLEGCNQVRHVYFYRLFQGLFGVLAAWAGILLGVELWLASIIMGIGLVYASFYLRRHYWEFFKSLLLTESSGPRLHWSKDILPFQWRVALSWISGYFLFSLFTPVLFYYHGPVVAGQMGMTWSLAAALSAVGVAWVSPKVPQYGILIAQKRYTELDRLFWRLIIIVTTITTLGAAALWLLIFGLNYCDHSLSHRLLPPLPAGIFLITTILHTASVPMSMYLMAHRKMPNLRVAVSSGIMCGIGTLVLGKYFSALGVSIAYLTTYLVAFPWIAYIWQTYRRKWHRVDS